jgi:hypothetical protein
VHRVQPLDERARDLVRNRRRVLVRPGSLVKGEPRAALDAPLDPQTNRPVPAADEACGETGVLERPEESRREAPTEPRDELDVAGERSCAERGIGASPPSLPGSSRPSGRTTSSTSRFPRVR